MDEQADTRADRRCWIILVVLLTASILTICTPNSQLHGFIGQESVAH